LIALRTHALGDVPVARGFWKRAIGLLVTTDPERLFLLIPKCGSIHTFGMRTAIDVIFLTKGNAIAAIYHAVRPLRFCVGPKDAFSVLELPPGFAADHELAVNDLVSFSGQPRR